MVLCPGTFVELICSPVDSSTVEVSNLKLYVELSNLRVFDVPVVEKSLVGSNDEVSNIR